MSNKEKDIQYINTVKDSNNAFGYQPTKSSSNNPSNAPVQTSSPPKKP